MTNTQRNEAHNLAQQVSGRYGRVALTRAAGEAASAERNGDHKKRDQWTSVIAHLRTSMLQQQTITA